MPPPVAIIAFNRPSQTARVFEAVRAAAPERLFLIADGPRPGHPTDAERTARVRAILDGVDWPCQTTRIYSDENLGCRERVGSGISAALDTVERCVVLEDDCLPDPSFFPFCAELLDRYADDERVMAVSGDCFQSSMGSMTFDTSYFATRYCHVWGWATWRRAWKRYEGVLERWPDLRAAGLLRRRLGSIHERIFWERWLDKCAQGGLNTWDIPWQLAIWEADGICLSATRNLVTNIGMDADGTHHTGESVMGELPVTPMAFPMTHPGELRRNAAADRWAERHLYSGSTLARCHRAWRHGKSRVRAALRGARA